MRSALVLTLAASFIAQAEAALPLETSKPTAYESNDLIQKAYSTTLPSGDVVSNFCKTPYNSCLINGMLLLGSLCECGAYTGIIWDL